jgi:hypothetical protein
LSQKSASKVEPDASEAKLKVLISYNHADTSYLDRLLAHLRLLERQGKIEIWVDTKIKKGALWENEINNALSSAKVAILLISADYLASDFIADVELPQILARAETGDLRILSLILSAGLFKYTDLNIYQAVNPPSNPIASMPADKREVVFAQVAKVVRDIWEEAC